MSNQTARSKSRHVPGNNVQTHEYMDLDKAKPVTDLISFTKFVMINKELTAD